MESDADEFCDPQGLRLRTLSNTSQQSQRSSKQHFPVMTSDSGLYTCSSNTSDCSLQFDSDTDFCHQHTVGGFKNEHLNLAMQDVRKLRSELERLTKSEQWYKHELKQQKTTRLKNLERIYTQERKFMQENQRLQKECVRLYEKCNELEKELEKHHEETCERHTAHVNDEDIEENILHFEKEQCLALIEDQQQLIVVLRKQKRSLLEDLRLLTEEKDGKVLKLQCVLAELELDNKRITKKCSQYAKERLDLQQSLKQSESRLSSTLQEKINLQKSLIDLKEQLEIRQQLLKLKESEIQHIQQHFTNKIKDEQDLDEVHKISIKYQEEINAKTLEVIHLKESLYKMQYEIEDMQKLQQQNELQQRQIDQLNFSLEAHKLELEEMKASEEHKNKQLVDLQSSIEQMLKDKEITFKNTFEQQNDLSRVKKALKSTQEQYEKVQELYKKTQFQLELLEIEQRKLKFQKENDEQEIEYLRSKLKEYLQQTTELSNKIKVLEEELENALKENSQLKQDVNLVNKEIKTLEHKIAKYKIQESLYNHLSTKNPTDIMTENLKIPLDSDFEESFSNFQDDNQVLLKRQQECRDIDFIHIHSQDNTVSQSIQEENITKPSILVRENDNCNDTNGDVQNLSLQTNKLQENLNILKDILIAKQQDSKQYAEKPAIENEIFKEKLETKSEVCLLHIKGVGVQKRKQIKEKLVLQEQKVKSLQENLLRIDAKHYKLERKLKTFDETDANIGELPEENNVFKEQLRNKQHFKADLNKKLLFEKDALKELKKSLEDTENEQKPTTSQEIQCNLEEIAKESSPEANDLKKHALQLEQQQRNFLENEALRKEQRSQFLQKLIDLQDNKIQNLQKHQHDWEDMLSSLNNAHSMEEETRKEFELKRMELEELNEVFAKQNEELRKLENFTALLEMKRQQEKEQLKITFQEKINVMQQNFKDCQKEIERQKHLNQQLRRRKNNDECALDVDKYKKEIRELKSRLSLIIEEKENLLEHFNELKKQNKELKDSKREAILVSDDICLSNEYGIPTEYDIDKVPDLKQIINDDHFRMLTKVLEAEYQTKMRRYDEHIHSLLSNLNSLKKSLKINEEKTALLSEEQLQTREELKDLQKTKKSLEEMRFKYEQSQNTIKQLKQTLASERKKFDLSDIGKSSQSSGPTYEVANLIDDYKKLIQQSALATKRPTSSAVFELIQRSNQCVPNLQKLESNVNGLRSDLQNFLSTYTQKTPATSFLTAAASLTVPPSLMDELRAASDGF